MPLGSSPPEPDGVPVNLPAARPDAATPASSYKYESRASAPTLAPPPPVPGPPPVPAPLLAPAPVPDTRPHNVLAWVSLGLAVASVVLGLFSSVPAIVCGHIARRQLRRTGEQGGPAALWGLILGYALSAIYLIGIIGYLLFLGFIIAVGTVANG